MSIAANIIVLWGLRCELLKVRVIESVEMPVLAFPNGILRPSIDDNPSDNDELDVKLNAHRFIRHRYSFSQLLKKNDNIYTDWLIATSWINTQIEHDP